MEVYRRMQGVLATYKGTNSRTFRAIEFTERLLLLLAGRVKNYIASFRAWWHVPGRVFLLVECLGPRVEFTRGYSGLTHPQ